ncbi:hypothetical protein [Streptomyces sp. LN325]|uniref:hypothetical protein n=1 Tax=Streptomyces sp. LN325 TaxID=3112976 RepID=UPI00371BF4D1
MELLSEAGAPTSGSAGGGADLVAFERGSQLAKGSGSASRRTPVEGVFNHLAQSCSESGLGSIEEL